MAEETTQEQAEAEGHPLIVAIGLRGGNESVFTDGKYYCRGERIDRGHKK